MKLKLVTTLVLLLFVITFMVQNTAIVEIRLLFWVMDMPRSLLVFMLLIIGIVIGWFLRAMYRLTRTTRS